MNKLLSSRIVLALFCLPALAAAGAAYADFTGADCAEIAGRPVNNLVALALAMRDGLNYSNVHTDIFPGGEIRGQMLERDDERDNDD